MSTASQNKKIKKAEQYAIAALNKAGTGEGSGGAVASVNGKTGTVNLTQDDIAAGTTNTTITPAEKSSYATKAGSETLTNKTLSGSNNNFSNIPQASVSGLSTELGKLNLYYLPVNVSSYSAAQAQATGTAKKIITVATDESQGNDTNVKYFYDGVDGVLSAYGDALSDTFYSRVNNKIIPKAGALTTNEFATTVTSKLNVDPNLRIIQMMGSPIKAVTSGTTWYSSTSHTALVDAQILGNALDVKNAFSATGIVIRVVTAGVFTADAVNGVALYSFSGGILTRIAQSANDGTIFNTTGYIQIPFTAPVAVNGETTVYFATALYNNSAQTTAPVLGQVSTGTVATINLPLLPNTSKLFFGLSAQASFPTSISFLSGASPATSNVNITPQFYLY